MLLAGDLFDSDNLYGQTAQELADALGRFRGRVFIAPGNHDFYAAHGPWGAAVWPENVHIFTSGRPVCVDEPELGCAVWGAAFTAAEEADGSALTAVRCPDDRAHAPDGAACRPQRARQPLPPHHARADRRDGTFLPRPRAHARLLRCAARGADDVCVSGLSGGARLRRAGGEGLPLRRGRTRRGGHGVCPLRPAALPDSPSQRHGCRTARRR